SRCSNARRAASAATPAAAAAPASASDRSRLVRIERVAIIEQQVRILLALVQNAVPDHEHVDFASHEAAEGVFGSVGDRLAAHVEAGVHPHRTAGLGFEGAEKGGEARGGLG